MRVAIIGFGKWGRNYLSAINQSGIARVTQVLVRNQNQIIGDPQIGEARVTSRLEEIECDAAIVATHPSVTVSYAVHFLLKNIPVMLEKPAGLSLNDALFLQSVANEHLVPLLISHQHLFSNVYQELKKRVNSDEVMQIETAAGNDGPYRDYSFICDYAPHDIAMILGLKLLEPRLLTSVTQSSGKHEGLCEFALSFEDGSQAKTKIWNDRLPKVRRLEVKIQNNTYAYDDINHKNALILNGSEINVTYVPSLTNAVNAFLRAVEFDFVDDYRFGVEWAVKVANLIDQIRKKQRSNTNTYVGIKSPTR
ncbi:MviM Predicted dehydrogenases and related proteins [Oxalobacteraceae bacterium]